MKPDYCSGIVVTCLILAGCNVHFPHSRPVTMPAPEPLGSFHHVAGLDIRFADRRDWFVYGKREDRFIAGRPMGRLNYTAAFNVGVRRSLPESVKSDQEFFSEARSERENDRTIELQRFDFQTEPGTGKWKTCMKYYKKFTTQDATNAPYKLLLYEETGYICRHPAIPGLLLRIDYSERYQANQEATGFRDRAEKFLGYAEFAAS